MRLDRFQRTRRIVEEGHQVLQLLAVLVLGALRLLRDYLDLVALGHEAERHDLFNQCSGCAIALQFGVLHDRQPVVRAERDLLAWLSACVVVVEHRAAAHLALAQPSDCTGFARSSSHYPAFRGVHFGRSCSCWPVGSRLAAITQGHPLALIVCLMPLRFKTCIWPALLRAPVSWQTSSCVRNTIGSMGNTSSRRNAAMRGMVVSAGAGLFGAEAHGA
ncbi:hypothetical protein D9M70_444850 [compost metagenome]